MRVVHSTRVADIARGVAGVAGRFRRAWRPTADQLDFPSRVLAVADIHEALTANRPYRAGMTREAALTVIARDRGTRLCSKAIDALEAHTVELDDVPTEL